MSVATVVDLLMSVSEDARQSAAHHPWLLPSYFVVIFAIGWFAPHVWDAARRHTSTATMLVGVALGGLVIAALAPVISTSSAVGPSCGAGTFTQACPARNDAHETCSQRYDDWQKWQRCVGRRTDR